MGLILLPSHQNYEIPKEINMCIELNTSIKNFEGEQEIGHLRQKQMKIQFIEID